MGRSRLRGDVDSQNESANDWKVDMTWNSVKPIPLFQRLDLEEIIEENSVKSSHTEDKSVHAVKGGKRRKKERKK